MNQTYNNIISFVWSKDVKKSLQFYEEILGFKKAYESQGWIELSIPGLKTGYIAINRWAKKENPPVNQFITLGVDDLAGFKTYLEGKKVEMYKETFEFYEEGIKMFKFYDPDGNILTAAEVEM
jgi:catechol 2,3-dioxygenase-like lactoylglutathione lyase family enzyme